MNVGDRTQVLFRQVRRNPFTAAACVMVAISCLASATASLNAGQAERDASNALSQLEHEVENRLYGECLASNDSRQSTRALVKDANKEAGEALIESVAETAELEVDQATVTAYRRILEEHLTLTNEKHASEDRDCELERQMRQTLD